MSRAVPGDTSVMATACKSRPALGTVLWPRWPRGCCFRLSGGAGRRALGKSIKAVQGGCEHCDFCHKRCHNARGGHLY